jgi:glycosyltransferase involved in cell wall biosynthesis
MEHKNELMSQQPIELVLDTGTDASPVPRICVIIPTYNRPDFLRLAVESVFAQDFPKSEYELIVVDSSPSRQAAETLRQLLDRATCRLRCYVKPAEGPGASRNVGGRNTRAPWLAFMDDDCQATPQWLSEAVAGFTDGIGVVQGRTLPDPNDKLGIFVHYIIVDKETPLFETANIFYRKQAFDQVGGFPERDLTPQADRPTGGEDVILGWNVKRAGWKSGFLPAALVFHAVLPISVQEWLWQKRGLLWPSLVKAVPELRQHLFARYFMNAAHAGAFLLILGIIGTLASPWLLLVALPYFFIRASEPSKTLRGPLKLLRPLMYLGRDVLAVCGLAVISIRTRSLLL